MNQFINAMKMHANLTDNDKYYSQIGILTSFDPSEYMGKVLLIPETDEVEALQTGWLRISSPWVGQSWGLFSSPRIGSLCRVTFQEGNLNTGSIDAFYYSNLDRPLNVPSEEFWLVHKTGTSIKLTNDGKLSINGHVEIDITTPVINITTTGDINVTSATANITTSGNVNVDATGSIKVNSSTSVSVNCNDISLGDLTVPITPPLQPIALSGGSGVSLHVKAN